MRAAAVVVALALLGASAVAGKGQEDSQAGSRAEKARLQKAHDEGEQAFKRELTVKAEKTKVEMESGRRDGDTKEKLKFELEVDDGLKIKMESHKQAADGTLSRERLQLRCNSVLVLSTLTDAAIGYQVGVDTVANTTDLGSVAWNDIACSTTSVAGTEEGTTVDVKSCTIATQNGLASFTTEVSGDIFVKGTAKVYPIALKLTIELDGQLAADQYYALGCTIQTINTGEKREEDSTKGEGVVKFGGAASTSFFSWETSAVDEADAVVPVVASSVVSAGTVDEIDPATMKNDKAYKRNIYFTFAAAGVSHILWDPQVGAGDSFAETSVGSSGARAAAVTAMALLPVVLAWAFA